MSGHRPWRAIRRQGTPDQEARIAEFTAGMTHVGELARRLEAVLTEAVNEGLLGADTREAVLAEFDRRALDEE